MATKAKERLRVGFFMTHNVRQIQVVQGEIAANKLLAEGWVYLQSVAFGNSISHVLGHENAVSLEDKTPRVHREAVSVSRTMKLT